MDIRRWYGDSREQRGEERRKRRMGVTVDLATAQNGNMVPAIVSWGYGTPENWPLLESTTALSDFLDLP